MVKDCVYSMYILIGFLETKMQNFNGDLNKVLPNLHYQKTKDLSFTNSNACAYNFT